MRIAVISTLASGGAAAAAWRITRALEGAGHTCSFFVLENTGGFSSYPLSGTAEPGAASSFWTDASFSRWAGFTSREKLVEGGTELFSDHIITLHALNPLPEALLHADAVHLHWVAGMLLSPALLQALQGKKIVWTLHDMNAFTGGCHYHIECRKFETRCSNCPLSQISGSDDASALGFRLKETLYPSLALSVVTPSQWLAGEARRSALLGHSPAVAIPNCIDSTSFAPAKNRPLIRRRLGLRDDSFAVLIGADHLANPRKNAQAALDALGMLAARHAEGIEVLAFGHGQLPPIPFPVHQLGYIEEESMLRAAYTAADIYVQSSLVDNLPNTLCEAQCCGTPVLSFDAGGCAETMIPGKTGFLVKEKTAEALAGALEEIYAKRVKLVSMRKAARVFAVERFNPQKVAAAYTEVFEQAKPAPGLNEHTRLFIDLLQNQIASLAAVVRDTSESHVRRLSGVEAHLPQINERFSGIEACLPQVDGRLVGIEAYLPQVDSRVAATEHVLNQVAGAHLPQMDERLSRIEGHLPQVDGRLADIAFHAAQSEGRFLGIEAYISHCNERLAAQTAQLEELHLRLDAMRHALRHPVRWFFKKLWQKLKR